MRSRELGCAWPAPRRPSPPHSPYACCPAQLAAHLASALLPRWPYRALKRAAKLGEVGAGGSAGAATVTSGGSKRSGASGSPATSSPLDSATPHSQQLSPGQGGKPVFKWDGPELPKASDTGDSEDSWQVRRPLAHTAAEWLASGASSLTPSMARQGSESLAPRVPAGKQPSSAPPRRRAGESRRRGSLDRSRGGGGGPAAAGAAGAARRGSLDLGVLARRQLSPSPEDSGSGSGGTPGLQRTLSGAMKRTREGAAMLVAPGGGPAGGPGPNPFALAAGGMAGLEHEAADQLAAGLSRLDMRTLSLKRQCSRDDTALDALDQALLMEVGGAMVGRETGGGGGGRRSWAAGVLQTARQRNGRVCHCRFFC